MINFDQPNKAPRRFALLVLAILLLAGGVRAVYLLHPVIDSDVATVGLMGMHVMKGEFSPLYWGQDYGGSQESLVAAPLFWLFGVSRHTLNAAAAVISLFYLWAIYLIGRHLYGRRGGLAALALAAVGPFILSWYSVQARGINIMVLTMGAWLLWACLKALATGPGKRGYLAYLGLFGLFSGIGLWAHMLMIYFVVPAGLIIWRRDPKLFIRPRLAWLAAAFLLGSSPLWYYNLTHDWATFHYMLHPKPSAGFMESLRYLGLVSLPVLAGLRFPGADGWLIPFVSQVMGVISAGLLLWALAVWGKNLLARLGGDDHGDGSELLLATLVSVTLIFCLLGGAASHSHRYLLSFYAVWPLVFAMAFARLHQWGRAARFLSYALLIAFMAFYLYGSMASTLAFNQAERHKHRDMRIKAEQWAGFLNQHGVRYAYTYDYWDSAAATFDAKEKAIFVLPWRDRHPGYNRALIRAEHTGFLVRPFRADELETSLQALGAHYQRLKAPVDCVAFLDLAPPGPRPELLTGLRFGAWAKPDKQDVAQAWDLNASTRWSSLAPQAPGQSFTLDLGAVTAGVCQVMIYSGQFRDAPDRLLLEGSINGVQWTALGRLGGDHYPWIWAGGKPVAMEEACWQELRFPPQPLRYLRLTQSGKKGTYYWSMIEVLAGALPPKPLPAPKPESAAAWVRTAAPPGMKIWCGPGLAAWLPLEMVARPTRQARPEWMREYQDPWLLMPQRRLLIALPMAREKAALRVLASCGWVATAHHKYGYSLIVTEPGQPGPGPIGPARTPGKVPGGLVWDLGGPTRLSGLEISGDAFSLLAPPGLGLEASLDGRGYGPVRPEALWPRQLYWAGIMPLAAKPYPLTLRFDTINARYLKLIKTVPLGGKLPGNLSARILPPGAHP